jgi:hypothetical protein
MPTAKSNGPRPGSAASGLFVGRVGLLAVALGAGFTIAALCPVASAETGDSSGPVGSVASKSAPGASASSAHETSRGAGFVRHVVRPGSAPAGGGPLHGLDVAGLTGLTRSNVVPRAASSRDTAGDGPHSPPATPLTFTVLGLARQEAAAPSMRPDTATTATTRAMTRTTNSSAVAAVNAPFVYVNPIEALIGSGTAAHPDAGC